MCAYAGVVTCDLPVQFEDINLLRAMMSGQVQPYNPTPGHRCVAAPDSLKSERNCTDLKVTINHAARRPPPPHRLQCLHCASPMPANGLHRAERLLTGTTSTSTSCDTRVRCQRSIWRSLSRDTRVTALQAMHCSMCRDPIQLSTTCTVIRSVCELRHSTHPLPARARHDNMCMYIM
jgi:hypothetical protein